MIQLPAGASDSMPGQGRDCGLGWRPGGVPGIQIRHSPSLGRCPGGTPSVAALLGPRFVSASPPRTSGLGSSMIVLVLCVQAPAANRPAKADMSARRRNGPPPKKSDQIYYSRGARRAGLGSRGRAPAAPCSTTGRRRRDAVRRPAAVSPSVQTVSPGYPAPTHGRTFAGTSRSRAEFAPFASTRPQSSETADEHLFVRRDPFGMLVRQLFEEVECALRNQRVLVGCKRGESFDARTPLLDKGPVALGIGDAAPVTAAEQVTKLSVHGRPLN